MSRESTPVPYQREYSIWDAVANKEITSAHVDDKGKVDVDEQLGRIFGTGMPKGSPSPHTSPRVSPRASPVRLRPILANFEPAPFQRQIKPRIPKSVEDPAIKLLGDEIRRLEDRNHALYTRVVVQTKLIVGFCEHEVLRSGKAGSAQVRAKMK